MQCVIIPLNSHVECQPFMSVLSMNQRLKEKELSLGIKVTMKFDWNKCNKNRLFKFIYNMHAALQMAEMDWNVMICMLFYKHLQCDLLCCNQKKWVAHYLS